MLVAENITLLRGGHPIIDGVGIDARPGSMLVILGPNGAGKTSLLKVLSGEWAPDSGRVLLNNRPLSSWPPLELARVRAVLPQESHLAFSFTVEEVVLLGRTPHAAAGGDPMGRAIALETLTLMEIESQADRLYTSLSGGEKQRVQLARVLTQVWDPPKGKNAVILLDEPTASLDLSFQFKILGIARDLAARGAAVVAVLHDLNLAAAYADDLLFLQDGRVVARGSPRDTIEPGLVAEVFGVRAEVFENNGRLRVVTYPMD
jgi:iron complex transport system ATP-binding protein